MKTLQEIFEPRSKGEKKFYHLHDPQLKIKVDDKVRKTNDDEFNAGNVKVFDRQKYRFGATPGQDASGRPCD